VTSSQRESIPQSDSLRRKRALRARVVTRNTRGRERGVGSAGLEARGWGYHFSPNKMPSGDGPSLFDLR